MLDTQQMRLCRDDRASFVYCSFLSKRFALEGVDIAAGGRIVDPDTGAARIARDAVIALEGHAEALENLMQTI